MVVEGVDEVRVEVSFVEEEAVLVDEVVVIVVELGVLVFSVGLKCGRVYSLNFGNLFRRFAEFSLKDLLVNPRPSNSFPFVRRLSSDSKYS